MRGAAWVTTLVLAVSAPPRARAIQGFLNFNRFEPFQRAALQRYLASTLPSTTPQLSWVAEEPGCSAQLAFWQWLAASGGGAGYRVLALPSHERRDVRTLIDMLDLLQPTPCRVVALPEASPVPGLVAMAEPSPPAPMFMSGAGGSAAAKARTGAWVERTLSPSGLRFCPYTGSATESAVGLEGFGVAAAPITYGYCGGSTLPALLVSFWEEAAEMLAGGEERTSSIVLAAPHWDDRFDEWCRTVFPLLEESVLSARLGRELGIVCFHPRYITPDEQWLSRHRFGHMHSPAKLRAYVVEHDTELADRVTDEELLWAGSYQRRSPHASINVLWARQLEQAEQKRKSSLLYTRNVQRALGEGRDALDAVAAAERAGPS